MTRFTFLLCGLSVLIATPVRACNIPVHRYALENWPTDSYRATVLHRGALTPEQRSVVDQLKERAKSANVDVEVIDLAHPDTTDVPERFTRMDVSAGPVLVVNYPAATKIDADVWSGPLTMDAVSAILDSPLRREIVRHLHAGEIVWLLLEGGAKQSATAKVFEDNKSTETASVLLRVRRDDPAERMLVSMLLNSEPDLMESREPMAFPIFGRGRVLYALVGEGISADNVRRAVSFLGGDCSCTVKRDSPGTDLLLVADWSDIRPSDAASEAGTGASCGVTTDSTPATPPAPQATSNSGSRGALWVAVVFAGCLVLLTGTLALRSLKQRSAD